MRTRQPTTTTLENLRIPVQAKLTAAWTSLMFFVIYIDYFHLYKPGAIDQIRGGGIFEFDITPTLLTIFVVVIGIPALMVLLSMTLPARANRATNLIVASLYSPRHGVQRGRRVLGRAYFYGLAIGIEVLDPGPHPALRLDLAPHRTVGDHATTSPDREAVRAQQQA